MRGRNRIQRQGERRGRGKERREEGGGLGWKYTAGTLVSGQRVMIFMEMNTGWCDNRPFSSPDPVDCGGWYIATHITGGIANNSFACALIIVYLCCIYYIHTKVIHASLTIVYILLPTTEVIPLLCILLYYTTEVILLYY